MLIINTTFNVSESCEEEWIQWARSEYIPEVIAPGLLVEPRFCRLLIENEADSQSYAIQFEVKDLDTLDTWFKEYGAKIQTVLNERFQEKVLSFTTVMENMELLPIYI
jgi:hypothetical protein